ncbi:dihydrodipicolinate reductase [Williamsia sp. DF01-3]|uniref:dihydrodipicolinate reductase n=1 Tax=Williamsia sp. DF01-3 TaxID=2934157 RepID=UPI001FF0FB30|nr:dihydrodipicolinate reductase [Williamsia sp. DF01-3]MCK0516722.1 dihydrodipicolinate reductase [Williamsia sp. DF01-3]
MIRVIVGFTGGVGSALARMVISNPGYELVGALVHAEDKAGKDIGDIVGVAPIGVTATRDIDELVALNADVLSWHGVRWEPEVIATFLRAGTNVYSGIGGWYLPSEPEFDLIEQAAAEGGSSLIAGGNIPGLISDTLPLFASGFSANITKVTARQSNHVPNYPSAVQFSAGLGFGAPIPSEPHDPDAPLSVVDELWTWGIRQSAQIVAQGLGLPFHEVKITRKDYAAAPDDLVLAPSGLEVKQGTVAGVRWTFTAFSGGTPYYELVNQQTCVLGLGPDWRQSESEPNWRVTIEGTPNIEVVLGVGDVEGPSHVSDLNAARALSMFARLVAADPGWRSVLDVPAAVGAWSANL